MKAALQTVLVVDDEPDLCEIVGYDLKGAGYEVLTANSGYEALDLVKSRSIDAIISDIRMPNGSGIDLLEGVKQRKTDRPVVLLMTGHSDLTIEDAFDKGAEVVLNKPIVPEHLLSALTSALLTLDERLAKRQLRLKTVLDIELQLPDSIQPMQSKALNVGRGGAFIAMSPGPKAKVGTQVEFRFRWRSEKPQSIEGQGIIRWARTEATASLPAGIGIEFISLSRPSREKLASLINDLKIHAFIPKS